MPYGCTHAKACYLLALFLLSRTWQLLGMVPRSSNVTQSVPCVRVSMHRPVAAVQMGVPAGPAPTSSVLQGWNCHRAATRAVGTSSLHSRETRPVGLGKWEITFSSDNKQKQHAKESQKWRCKQAWHCHRTNPFSHTSFLRWTQYPCTSNERIQLKCGSSSTVQASMHICCSPS